MTRTCAIRLTAVAALLAAAPANAEIPEPVQAMIDAALEGGHPSKIEAIIELAIETNPDDRDELLAIKAAFDLEMAELARMEAEAEELAIRSAGMFDHWSGKGEFGGFRATGNSSNTGVSAKIALRREGIEWRHKLSGRADYQRSNGRTSRERFLAAYEPNLLINERLYAYALGQFERDTFQGFEARYSLSGGVGYDVLVGKPISLSVNGGPAIRHVQPVIGPAATDLAALASLDFDWRIAKNLTFTQDASTYLQRGSTTFTSETGLQAGISEAVSVRFSYTFEYDTDPRRRLSTDTLSRVTLIYGF